MKNFTTYLSFALMATIVGIVVFHSWIWPCGPGTDGEPSASNTVEVETTAEYDSTEYQVNREDLIPVKIVYRDKPFLPTRYNNVEVIVSGVPSPTTSLLSSSNQNTPLVLTKEDSAAIVELYLREIVYYSDTPELPDSLQISLTINDSIGANKIAHRSIIAKNLRPTSKTKVNSYYADRFMVFPGLQFGALTDWQNQQFVPMAGIDLTMKFKTNTSLRVGYMIGPGQQLYSVGVNQLIRFEKWGNAIRTRQLNRKISKGILTQ